jgi:hypothetical protein
MARTDRMAIANWAIKSLAPLVRTQGTYVPSDGRAPAYRKVTSRGLQIFLIERVLLSPVEKELSSSLDLWPAEGGRKCMSVVWVPERPWQPPRLSSFRKGTWLQAAGWVAEK